MAQIKVPLVVDTFRVQQTFYGNGEKTNIQTLLSDATDATLTVQMITTFVLHRSHYQPPPNKMH